MTIIRPRTELSWNGEDLSEFVYDIEINLGNTKKFPTISFSIDPVRKPEHSFQKTITLRIEYPGRSSVLRGEFIHSGTELKFGREKSLIVKGIGKANLLHLSPRRQQNFIGERQISRIIGDKVGEYGFSMDNFFLAEDLVLREWSYSKETDGESIIHLAQTNGNKIKWNISSNNIGTLIPASSKDIDLEEETDQEKFNFFLIGPTLIENVSKNYKLKNQGSEKRLDGKKQEGNGEEDKDINPTEGDAVNNTTESSPDRLSKSGQKTSSESLDSKEGTSETEIKEQKKKEVEEESIEISFNVLAVPKLIGITPSDGLLLKEDELDYKVSGVRYSQVGNYFSCSISATRTIDEEPMFPKAIDKMRSKLESLGEEEDEWAKYYWGQN